MLKCKFKAKDPEMYATPLCLGNVSKVFSVDNIKKIRLVGCVYDFLVNYHSTDFDLF